MSDMNEFDANQQPVQDNAEQPVPGGFEQPVQGSFEQPVQNGFDPNVMPNAAYQEPQKSGNGMAIAAMVLGIVGLLACCLNTYVGIVAGIVAIILGVMARKKDSHSGMALAGIVLGIITVALALICIVIVLAFGSAFYDILESSGYTYY